MQYHTSSLHGKRVTVMGLGRFGGGLAAARWCASHGAEVTVTDLAEADRLAESVANLAGVPIAHCHFGGHREEDFRDCDLLVVNPAVRPGSTWLRLAKESGAELTTEAELFLRNCPGRVVAVTGSNGKSTTAAMIADIFQAAGRTTWLGGNIGNSLLEQVDRMRPDDWVVLEISSFQLHYLAADTPRPFAAVVTACAPNHLDWHGSYEAYAAAKQRLIRGTLAAGIVVLGTADPSVRGWRPLAEGQIVEAVADDAIPTLRVPGHHNRLNAACAAALARATGCAERDVEEGLRRFGGLPQRLEWIAVVGGRRFYNDSASTTPDSTIAALSALAEPVWLIAGGRNKGLPLDGLVEAIGARASGVALLGECALPMHELLSQRFPHLPCSVVEGVPQAVAWCFHAAQPEGAVLFSPAMASGNQFLNYRHRGECFRQAVADLARADTNPAPSPANQ